MRRVFILSLLAAGFISCMACTGNDAQLSVNNGSGTSAAALISKTKAYPSDYATEAMHRGRVERIDYDTRDYAEGTGAARTNTAYVYLPYGYDENTAQRYNVIYLVHGHYGTASTTFEAEDGLQRKVLDHMVENGDMARPSLCRRATTMDSLQPVMWMQILIAVRYQRNL